MYILTYIYIYIKLNANASETLHALPFVLISLEIKQVQIINITTNGFVWKFPNPNELV